MIISSLTRKLQTGNDLSRDEATRALEALIGNEASETEQGEFLVALAQKGETAEEIAALALALRERAVNPGIDHARLPDTLLADVCGTGADGLQTFNVSTASMFIVAAAGVAVAKHGNRGITSRCGGADVLEALGVRLELPPDRLKSCVEEIGAGFIFAPAYHPAFKQIGPVRRRLAERKMRTVFNILGPLVNPARVNVQLIGVFDPSFTPKLAEVLRLMGHRRAMVVHGFVEGAPRGMDELSTLGRTQISELTATGDVKTYSLDAAALGLNRPTLDALSGGDARDNAAILRRILSGEETAARIDLVLLNASAALVTCGKASDFGSGLVLARRQIENGAALEVLEKLIKFTNR